MISISVQSQNWPLDSISNKISYSEVVIVPAVSKQELFHRATMWFTLNFKSSKDVVQLSDENSGEIIGKGSFNVDYTGLGAKNIGFVSFTILVSVKDGKYKYQITDFWHDGGVSNVKSPGDLLIEKPGWTITKGAWLGVKEQTKSNVSNIIESLKISMGKQTIDNW